MTFDPSTFTYGAELEFADIDSSKGLPEGFGWDRRDFSMVNSDGIAVDPKHIYWTFGGEINTPPTDTLMAQVQKFKEIREWFPEASVNYRSNLHIHVGVPGLAQDLEALKKLQCFIHGEFRMILPILEPIPRPTAEEYPTPIALAGAQWRYKRRKKSHQTFLTDQRVAHQLKAETVEDFMVREVPTTKSGVPMWHAQARTCVNLRQLRETGSIEFRHFPGTLDPDEFYAALLWCHHFMDTALNQSRFSNCYELFDWFTEDTDLKLPKFKSYDHRLETGYKMTCHDGTLSKQQIGEGIDRILYGELETCARC